MSIIRWGEGEEDEEEENEEEEEEQSYLHWQPWLWRKHYCVLMH